MRVAGTNFEKAFILWGIEDIVDTSATYAPRSPESPPKFNNAFDVGDASTQIRMLQMCTTLRNRTDIVSRILDLCPMEAIKQMASALGYSFPMNSTEMVITIAKLVKEQPTRAKFFGLEYVTDATTGATTHRVSWMRLNILTAIPFRATSLNTETEYFTWLDFMKEFEAETFTYDSITAPPTISAQARITAPCFVRMATELQAIRGTVGSIGVSLAFAVFATFIFTGDIFVAAMALFSMVAIISAVIAILVYLGVKFGIVEAISLTILVGISVDFSLHLAEAFTRSHFTTRGLRGVDAVSRVGYPIFSAALTTMSAVLPMLSCEIQILVRFGQIIPLCIIMSLAYGLHFFAPMLMALGPNTFGSGAGKWCCYMGKLPNLLFATQTRRMTFLVMCGFMFGLTLPSTQALLFENGGEAYVVAMVAFAFLAAASIFIEEFCRGGCRWRRRSPPPDADTASASRASHA